MSEFYKNVAVFCGSQFGNDRVYASEARIIGNGIRDRKIHAIYGGGDAGLMGEFARSAEGTDITAIIPRAFIKPAGLMHASHNTIEVETLLERVHSMIAKADAAIALPGGTGTFEEIFATLAVNDLNKYLAPETPIKPIILVSTDGHFEGISQLYEKAIGRGFTNQKMLNVLRWAPDAGMALEILDELRSRPPVPVSALL